MGENIRTDREAKGRSQHESKARTSLAQILIEKLYALQLGSGVRRVFWGIAVLVFLVAFVISLRAVPQAQIQLPWILLALAISPVVLLLNGLEYCVAGQIIGHRIKLPEALRVSVLSSAANLLPLPGGVLVRSHALKRRGAKYRTGFAATVSIGVGWLTMSLLLAAGALLKIGDWTTALLFSIGGAAGLLAATWILHWLTSRPVRALLLVLGLETLFVIVTGVGLYAALRAVSLSATLLHGIGLTVAGALASAVGLFPGGLGLREVLAGVLGPVVGLPFAAGVLGVSVDRLIGLCVLAGSAIFFLLRSNQPPTKTVDRSLGNNDPGEETMNESALPYSPMPRRLP